MEIVKLSTKGQLVIPKEIRKAHHLAVGTEFVVSFVGNEIRLHRCRYFRAPPLPTPQGCWHSAGEKA